MDHDSCPNATGTYVRIIRCGRSPWGDAYLVLYLLPSGLYLFIGDWKGYELTIAAGIWKEYKERVMLEGMGRSLLMDVIPFDRSPHRHAREFRIAIEDYSPALIAETEHEGWSLLSWRGHLHYVGKYHFFDLHNDKLPKSLEEIEPWTRQFIDDCRFCS